MITIRDIRSALGPVKRLVGPCQWVHTFSQEGEDRILGRVFEKKAEGFYVDVGAHHPIRLSNTYLFYRRGWHGINIDAAPGSMTAFMKMRPDDINLEIAIGEKPGSLVSYLQRPRAEYL